MVDDLHDISVGISTIEAARAIAVCARFLENVNALRLEKKMPRVHLLNVLQHEPEVVETLLRRVGMRAGNSMQSEIVSPASEVDIVRIRAPFDAHAEQFRVKTLTGLQVAYLQGDMPQAER